MNGHKIRAYKYWSFKGGGLTLEGSLKGGTTVYKRIEYAPISEMCLITCEYGNRFTESAKLNVCIDSGL